MKHHARKDVGANASDSSGDDKTNAAFDELGVVLAEIAASSPSDEQSIDSQGGGDAQDTLERLK